MKMKLTAAFLIMLLPFITGCSAEVKSETGSAFIINLPSQNMSGDTSRIRFNQIKKKDEKALAMEKAAGHWNRNLYLMGGNVYLADYADSCGSEK
jgi:hypothetical protein